MKACDFPSSFRISDSRHLLQAFGQDRHIGSFVITSRESHFFSPLICLQVDILLRSFHLKEFLLSVHSTGSISTEGCIHTVAVSLGGTVLIDRGHLLQAFGQDCHNGFLVMMLRELHFFLLLTSSHVSISLYLSHLNSFSESVHFSIEDFGSANCSFDSFVIGCGVKDGFIGERFSEDIACFIAFFLCIFLTRFNFVVLVRILVRFVDGFIVGTLDDGFFCKTVDGFLCETVDDFFDEFLDDFSDSCLDVFIVESPDGFRGEFPDGFLVGTEDGFLVGTEDGFLVGKIPDCFFREPPDGLLGEMTGEFLGGLLGGSSDGAGDS